MMKYELKKSDMRLLVIALSALILVVTFRLGVFPAMDAYEAEKIEYAEKCALADQMQGIIDERPANAIRISEGLSKLDEMSALCYEVMENRQIDELVTGIALEHELFPSYLSISGQTEGICSAYLYSPKEAQSDSEAVAALEQPVAQEPASAVTIETEQDFSGTIGGTVRRAEASLSVTGSESEIKAFLNDIEKNYPAIHVKSFEMSEKLHMDTRLQPVTDTQMYIVLEIYMYSRPEIQ